MTHTEKIILAAIPGMVSQTSGYPRKRNEKGRSAGGTEQFSSQGGYHMKQGIKILNKFLIFEQGEGSTAGE